VLAAVVPLQDLGDRGLEVVVDGAARRPTPELEGMALPQEEGLLALGGEDLQEHRPREAQASGQERHGAQLPLHLDGGLPEVELGALARSERQRHKGRSSRQLLRARARSSWRTVDSPAGIPRRRNSSHIRLAVHCCLGFHRCSHSFSWSQPRMGGNVSALTGALGAWRRW